jgi:hypothetical protein
MKTARRAMNPAPVFLNPQQPVGLALGAAALFITWLTMTKLMVEPL